MQRSLLLPAPRRTGKLRCLTRADPQEGDRRKQESSAGREQVMSAGSWLWQYKRFLSFWLTTGSFSICARTISASQPAVSSPIVNWAGLESWPLLPDGR